MSEQTQAEPKKKKLNKQQKKYFFSVAIMLLMAGLAVYYVLQGDAVATFNSMANAKSLYVFLMVGIVVLAQIIEGIVLAVLTKMYKRSYKVYQGTLNGMIGGFFSDITPSASGGQFVQAYTFSKQGVRPADSASVLVMLFIVSQIVIVLYGVLAMIFGYSTMLMKMSPIKFFNWQPISPMIFSVIGLCINVFALFFLFLMAYSKGIHRFVLTTVINIGAKMHLIKDPERKKASLAAQVATFRIETARLMKNAWILILTLVLEFIKSTCYNLLPYLAGLALGIDMTGKFFDCLWGASYLGMMNCVVPLPGASGSAEFGFQLIFNNIYANTEALTSAANLMARFVSFYMPLIGGFIVFVFYRASPKGEIYKYDNRKTFVDLQIVSLAQSNDPVLREVVIATPGEKGAETTTAALSPSEVKNAADSPQEEAVKKKHIIWPWSKHKEKKAKEVFMSPEQVQHSFDQIRASLIMDQKDVYQEETEISLSSKDDLKKVYEDVSQIEKDDHLDAKNDTEIELAIKADLDALKAEEDKKSAKRALKEARREERQRRHEAKIQAKAARRAEKDQAKGIKDNEENTSTQEGQDK
jgi:uncharacterized protein (TIRG00374 family)